MCLLGTVDSWERHPCRDAAARWTSLLNFPELSMLDLSKGVPGCQKNTWGRLNIFVHRRWTYLPPRDLYDVILPNLGLF